MGKVYGDLKINGDLIYNNNPIAGYFLTTDEYGLVSWTQSSAGLVNLIQDTTHVNLILLKNSNNLIPGTYYRITDFQTIYDQPDYSAPNTPKTVIDTKYAPVTPLVVQALSNSILSEHAFQEEYPGDKIKYQLEYTTPINNITTKGRIIERIDEYNNHTQFDHREVLFKRYETTIMGYTNIPYSYYDTGGTPWEFKVFYNDYYFNLEYCKNNKIVNNFIYSVFDLPNIVFNPSVSYGHIFNLEIIECDNISFADGINSKVVECYNSTIILYLQYCNVYKIINSSINQDSFFGNPITIHNSTISYIDESFILFRSGVYSNNYKNSQLSEISSSVFEVRSLFNSSIKSVGGIGDLSLQENNSPFCIFNLQDSAVKQILGVNYDFNLNITLANSKLNKLENYGDCSFDLNYTEITEATTITDNSQFTLLNSKILVIDSISNSSVIIEDSNIDCLQLLDSCNSYLIEKSNVKLLGNCSNILNFVELRNLNGKEFLGNLKDSSEISNLRFQNAAISEDFTIANLIYIPNDKEIVQSLDTGSSVITSFLRTIDSNGATIINSITD